MTTFHYQFFNKIQEKVSHLNHVMAYGKITDFLYCDKIMQFLKFMLYCLHKIHNYLIDNEPIHFK